MKGKQKSVILGKIALWGAIALVVFGFFFYGLQNVRNEVSEQSKTKLEEAVRRAAVACYAAEGAYAPSVEYLEEHYFLSVDETHYIVHYEVFADNILPDITVMEVNP